MGDRVDGGLAKGSTLEHALHSLLRAESLNGLYRFPDMNDRLIKEWNNEWCRLRLVGFDYTFGSPHMEKISRRRDWDGLVLLFRPSSNEHEKEILSRTKCLDILERNECQH